MIVPIEEDTGLTFKLCGLALDLCLCDSSRRLKQHESLKFHIFEGPANTLGCHVFP